jgi:hypothetical protein
MRHIVIAILNCDESSRFCIFFLPFLVPVLGVYLLRDHRKWRGTWTGFAWTETKQPVTNKQEKERHA